MRRCDARVPLSASCKEYRISRRDSDLDGAGGWRGAAEVASREKDSGDIRAERVIDVGTVRCEIYGGSVIRGDVRRGENEILADV